MFFAVCRHCIIRNKADIISSAQFFINGCNKVFIGLWIQNDNTVLNVTSDHSCKCGTECSCHIISGKPASWSVIFLKRKEYSGVNQISVLIFFLLHSRCDCHCFIHSRSTSGICRIFVLADCNKTVSSIREQGKYTVSYQQNTFFISVIIQENHSLFSLFITTFCLIFQYRYRYRWDADEQVFHCFISCMSLHKLNAFLCLIPFTVSLFQVKCKPVVITQQVFSFYV